MSAITFTQIIDTVDVNKYVNFFTMLHDSSVRGADIRVPERMNPNYFGNPLASLNSWIISKATGGIGRLFDTDIDGAQTMNPDGFDDPPDFSTICKEVDVFFRS